MIDHNPPLGAQDYDQCRDCGISLSAEPSWLNLFLHKRCYDSRKERLEAQTGNMGAANDDAR